MLVERPLWPLYAEGVLWARNCAQMSSVRSVSSVREKTPQRVVCVSSHIEGAFFFSQKNTDEQNTQGFTETSSQPISQSLTANVSWKASVNSVCRRRSVGSKLCAKMLSELCALCERKISPRLSSVFFFSQKNTDEQNTQHSTETLSQPISQNLTAIFSYNVLWILYAGGVLWDRNSAQKGSVKSVSSVREKPSTKYASSPVE